MRRFFLSLLFAVVAGLTLLGCSTAPSATPKPVTTTAPAFVGTPEAWVTANVKTRNQKLNLDQDAVDVASAEGGEANAGAFFARLKSTCAQLLADATRAQQLPKAPSALLARAWATMTLKTQAYASDCLTLVRTRTNADFSTWQGSLKAMDAANAALNREVNAVRGIPSTPAA